ncbi:MAG: molybdenum cofactor guanylyltransferase [Burkholderiales bacterium]|nr:molybdenum cofactor guanylyltransferase [Burkholderiales bacterium]
MKADTRIGVSGLILAGGAARRMGGVDKGLQPLAGRALVDRVIERFRGQVEHLYINPAANQAHYRGYGFPLVEDVFRGEGAQRAGPLAGLHAGLAACADPLLATVPCDAPFLPADLVARLREALDAAGAHAAVVRTAHRLQSVFLLARRELGPELARFLEAGGRKVEDWLATVQAVQVRFEDEAAFANLNTLEELERMGKGA